MTVNKIRSHFKAVKLFIQHPGFDKGEHRMTQANVQFGLYQVCSENLSRTLATALFIVIVARA